MTDSGHPLTQLLGHRVIALLGKGGAGRTSVAAGLSLMATGRGMRVLVMETDPRAPIAAAYDQPPRFQPCQLTANLWSMLLDRQQSLEEYLSFVVARPILRAVFASSLYQYFVHAAPAVRELMMMGKVYHEIERRSPNEPRWDLIVVDLPASGQALGMIGMPFAARETFGDNLVGREAEAVGQFFRDRKKCAMAVVTSVDQLAITETLEIHRKLGELGLVTAAIVFNRMSRATFEAVDVTRLFGRDTPIAHREEFAVLARADLNHRVRERRALGILKRTIGAPIIQLGDYRERSGKSLAISLAEQLAGIY
jgi:anion-transporting  ArsA/GET3 family ATPase